MHTHLARDTRAFATVSLLLLSAACGDSPTMPVAPEPAALGVAHTGGVNGFSVLHLTLRPADGSETSAWGELTVFVGALLPPNPCLPAVQQATVLVCGVIHNPGEELLTGGTLLVQASPDAPRVQLEFAAPPNPCLTYEVRAAAAADLGTAAGVRLPAVQAVFTFEAGALVAATPGPPNDPSGSIQGTPGPPDAPPNPCLVQFLTQRAG